MIRRTVLYLYQLEFARCLGVGGSMTAVFYSIFLTFNEWYGWEHNDALIAGFIPTFVAGFLLQKYWTFRSVERRVMHRQLAFYTLKKSLFFGINKFALDALVVHAGMRASIAQGLLTLVLGALSYVMLRWIFKGESPRRQFREIYAQLRPLVHF